MILCRQIFWGAILQYGVLVAALEILPPQVARSPKAVKNEQDRRAAEGEETVFSRSFIDPNPNPSPFPVATPSNNYSLPLGSSKSTSATICVSCGVSASGAVSLSGQNGNAASTPQNSGGLYPAPPPRTMLSGVAGSGPTLPTGTGRISAALPTITPGPFVNQSSVVGSNKTGAVTATINCNDCSTYTPGDPVTVWSILPNTNTLTVTIMGNLTTSSYTPVPEFTPPVTCPYTCIEPAQPFTRPGPFSTTKESTAQMSSSSIEPKATQTLTIVLSSKNPDHTTTIAQYPTFPNDKTEKQTVSPTASDTYIWSYFPQPTGSGAPLPMVVVYNEDLSAKAPITVVEDSGLTVVVSPSQAVIGGQVFAIGGPQSVVTVAGDTFTIGPAQVNDNNIFVYVPKYSGGIFQQSPTPTTVQGVSIGLNPTGVVIAGSTYAAGPGAPEQTIVVKGQTISVGSGGVAFSGTTIDLPPTAPTNMAVIGGQVFSVIGSTVAVIGGTTFTYGPGVAPQTDVFNGDTITIGPSGVSYDGTTLGGTAHPSGTQFGLAGGLSISEIGSTLAVVGGQTFTVGPGAKQTTVVIEGQTLTVGPSGIGINGASLAYPFIPITQAVTAGGVTFSEVGSSVVVIGGTSYTIGPGAPTTTEVFDGQTISIGPGGLGFATTTFTGTSFTATATSTSKKKNGAERPRPAYGVLGIAMFIWIGYFI